MDWRPLTTSITVALLLACGTPSGFESPEQLAAAGTELLPAENNRIGEWTYRLDRITQEPGGATIQFVLANGTSRGASTVMLRVAVRSLEGDYRSVRVPSSVFRAGQRRVLSAHLPPIEFAIDGVSIELLWDDTLSRVRAWFREDRAPRGLRAASHFGVTRPEPISMMVFHIGSPEREALTQILTRESKKCLEMGAAR